MIRLPESIRSWGSPQFEAAFKVEVAELDSSVLPLQQGLALSDRVSDSELSVVMLDSFEEAGRIRVKTGIFYSGILAGSCCADDPSPPAEQTEYCEVLFEINIQTGEAVVVLCENQ